MENMEEKNVLLNVIKASLWGTPVPEEPVTDSVFLELKRHNIVALTAPILPSLYISSTLRDEWKTTIFQQITHQVYCKYIQDHIAIKFPYVVLKGTTAAQYYPHPEYRALGDIDIMTRHEDYELTCIELLANDYIEDTTSSTEDFGRHRVFIKKNICIEVHSFFAMLNDPQKAEYLDELIINNINSTHILPDLVNGLVLLEHINQHLEEGIGLRQIIDWMMFVEKCLPDEKWPEFNNLAQKIGLEKLARVSTRICELYLGLRPHSWCKSVDMQLCKDLMNYVIACGNFGESSSVENGPGARLISYSRTPAAFFRLLQERGLVNWGISHKHIILKPFAWIYQIGRYFRNIFRRNHAVTELKTDIKAAQRRVALFDALGVKQTSKGLAIYEDGKYVKTYKRP